MKHFLRGLSVALVLLLCLIPALASAEGSILGERMSRAYESGREVEAVFSAKLGDGLALFLPEETYGALQQLLTDTRIVTHWAKDGDGSPAMGLRIGIGDVEVLSGTARITEGGVAIDTSLLPGKTVLIPIESMGELASQQPLPVELDEETAALFAQAYETYFGIVTSWAMETEGMYDSDEIELGATNARGEVVRTDHLTVTAAQLKDLLVRLTDTFEQDAQLQAALESALAASGDSEGSISDIAKALSEGARELAPLSGALKLDAYMGADEELMGLEFQMTPMFEGAPQTAFAQYDRLGEDGYEAYAFQARVGLDGGGMAAAKVSYSAEESHTESMRKSDILLRGMYQEANGEPISQVTLTDTRQTEQKEGQERLTDAIEFTMEQLTPDGSAQVEDSTPMTAVIGTLSVTNEGAGDDFDSDITVSLGAFGMEFAVLNLKMSSAEYAPIDTSANTVVDLTTATPEEQAGLMEELQTGLGMALMNAMQAVPPELLQMLQSE